MSSQRRALQLGVTVGWVGVGVGGWVAGGVVGVVVGVVVAGVVSVVGWVVGGVGVGVVVYLVSLRRLRRGAQAPADLRTVPPRTAGSLRWVRGLLPKDEGVAWWAEVTSCLAETRDKSTRRRYVRSYRRNVLQLIWTSWSEHLSASRQRELF